MKINAKYKVLITIFLIIVFIALFYTFFVQVRKIESGFIGVKASIDNPTDSSNDYDITTVKGYVCFMPLLTELTIYPLGIQTVTYDQIEAESKDVLSFKIKSTISYKINEKDIVKFYNSCDRSLKRVNDGYLKTIIQSVYSSELSQYMSDSLLMDKQTFDHSIDSLLSLKINEIGLILCNIDSKFEYPKEVKEKIDLRNKAIQSQIIADTQKYQAENEAKIQLIKADALRQQDSLINSALTHLSIQKMFIEKWDGKLPVYGETPKLYKKMLENEDF